MSKKIIKHHWLHGDIEFDVDVKEEDNCAECIHRTVCKYDVREFCLNFSMGTSDTKESCKGCIHRHTRKIWNEKDGIPCFKCKHFATKRWSVS